MEQLKQLSLTENDFKLLIEGLDALPEKDAASLMMGDLLANILIKDDLKKEEFERERMKKRVQAERNKDLMKDEVRILQGKLLLVKRYLIENNLLKEIDSMINP